MFTPKRKEVGLRMGVWELEVGGDGLEVVGYLDSREVRVEGTRCDDEGRVRAVGSD